MFLVFLLLISFAFCSNSTFIPPDAPRGWYSMRHSVFYADGVRHIRSPYEMPRGDDIDRLSSRWNAVPVEHRILVVLGRSITIPVYPALSAYQSHVESLRFIDTRLLKFLCRFASGRGLSAVELAIETASDVVKHFRALYEREFDHLTTDHVLLWYEIITFDNHAAKPKILIPVGTQSFNAPFVALAPGTWKMHFAKLMRDNLVRFGYEFA